MKKLVRECWSRGFKRHPLLQTSSPLNINRELTLRLEQRTGADHSDADERPHRVFRGL